VLAARLNEIAIPDEHAWTEARAAAWWRDYRPPEPSPNVPSAEQKVIMPGRTAGQRPQAATGERSIAKTMAGPTSIEHRR